MTAFLRWIATGLIGRRVARFLPGGWLVFLITSPRFRRRLVRMWRRRQARRLELRR